MKKFYKSHWIIEEVIFLTILAIPPSIVCLTEGIQMKISSIFIGRSSGEKVEQMLSALFIGQVVTSITSYPISDGFAVYVNILGSQAYGAKQYKLVGLYFYRALFMAALTVFPLCTLFLAIRPIVYSFTQDQELAHHAGSYTAIFSLGLPAYIYFKVAIRFLQVHNIVWAPLLYLLVGNIVNGFLQYVLVVQYNADLAGAAGGYVISLYLIALLLYAHTRFTQVHLSTLFNWSVEMIGDWHHTARYTLSPILQKVNECFTTGLLPLIVLGLVFQDSTQLTVYTVLNSLWYVFGLFSTGFSSAITVRVGNLLGAYEARKAFRAAIFSLFYGASVLLLLTMSLFFSSQFMGHLFTTDPTLIGDLVFNIKCFCFIIISDVMHFSGGIMSACCMPGIEVIIKFIVRTLLSSFIWIILTQFVWWKALGIFVSTGFCNFICFLISLSIILFRSWKGIAHRVTENTRTKEEIFVSEKTHTCIYSLNCNESRLCSSSIYETKKFQIVRYCVCFLLGILMFAVVAFTQL